MVQLNEFNLSVIQQESDPLIVQIVAGSEMVILVGYEVHIGETVGTMNFCVPLLVLNPILDQISQQAHFSRKLSDELATITRNALKHTISKAQVPVEVFLGKARLALSDVAGLQVGDVHWTPRPRSRRRCGLAGWIA